MNTIHTKALPVMSGYPVIAGARRRRHPRCPGTCLRLRPSLSKSWSSRSSCTLYSFCLGASMHEYLLSPKAYSHQCTVIRSQTVVSSFRSQSIPCSHAPSFAKMTSTQDKEHHAVRSPDEERDSEHSESLITTPASRSNESASLLTLPSELRIKILRYLLCLDNTREQSYTAGEFSVLGFHDTCCKILHTPEPDFNKSVFEPKQMMETSYHIETEVTTSCRQLASEGNRILYFENVFAVIAGLAEEDLFLLSVAGVTCQFTMSSPEYRRKFLEPPRGDDIETRRISLIVIGMHLGAERSNDVLLVPMTELHLALDVCRQIASGCNAYRTKGGMYKSRYGKVGISLSSCMKVPEIYHLPAHEVQVFWRQEFVSWFGTQLSPLAVDFRTTYMHCSDLPPPNMVVWWFGQTRRGLYR